GGGASLGSVQVGMLEALAGAGVRPDLVVGTSVGAINGALVAAEGDRATAHLARIWKYLRKEDVFPGGVISELLTLERSHNHVFNFSGLELLIGRHLSVQTFEELAIPFMAIATRADDGTAQIFTSGPLAPALLASAAIPGAFPSVEIAGQSYFDGGLVANVPMLQAIEVGAASLVVLDCGNSGRGAARPSSLAETILFSVHVMIKHQAIADLPEAARQVPVVYLPRPQTAGVSPFDFSASQRLMDEAQAVAARFLDDLAVTGPGVYGAPPGWAGHDASN
ncbi:MAG: patatin-like phospholipase family protein, partial [Acidimicrobiales bacterium]